MSRAVWTPVAESDLDEILFYIAFVDRSPATGERIYFEIRNRVAAKAEKGAVRSSASRRAKRLELFQALPLACVLPATRRWD
ncbi:MAG: hypothetical protein DWQ37_05680 [Planctomycetota bacterium]|nr:MAG: hypothetical protein DWQ37_05680 [Planctomycetota bacterium]